MAVGGAEAQAKASGEALKKLLRREIDDLARRKALQVRSLISCMDWLLPLTPAHLPLMSHWLVP